MGKFSCVIEFNESDLFLTYESGNKHQISWKDVYSVSVFKRDLLGYDEICMELETADRRHEVNEEFKGWDLFVNKLPDYLEGCDPYNDWFQKIIHPAFATNLTQIFAKKP